MARSMIEGEWLSEAPMQKEGAQQTNHKKAEKQLDTQLRRVAKMIALHMHVCKYIYIYICTRFFCICIHTYTDTDMYICIHIYI